MSKLFLFSAVLLAISTTMPQAEGAQLIARCRAVAAFDGGPLGVGFYRERSGGVAAVFNKGVGFRVATENGIGEGPVNLFGGQMGWTNQRGFEMAVNPNRPNLRKVRFTLDGARREAMIACSPSSF